MTVVAVIAKECLPGRVKTRLTPPFTPAEAARLASACLEDTLAAATSFPASRRVLYFDGDRAPASAAAGGFEVLPQVGGPLDERLAHLFGVMSEPTLLLGMDTPQLTAADVAPVFTGRVDGADCWLGPAADGGFWALAMCEPRGDVIRGVPMSRDDTGARQLARLRMAGLHVDMLPMLTDIDTVDDALAVADSAPASRFARELRSLRTGRPA
jgi:glycosyltransferase A (GT-A) superfamily protein (DUF2064 family)